MPYDPRCVYCVRCGRCNGNGSYKEFKYGTRAGSQERVSYEEVVTCGVCKGRGGDHKNSSFKCPTLPS